MWHRQFGVLIDVTCYRGLLTTVDEMIYKVNSLSPSEVTRNLTRIYIYNMNSVYRKCFRRVMRPISKDPSNIFHASNVDYYLVGSLKELQTHFNLGSLQLPKDTSMFL